MSFAFIFVLSQSCKIYSIGPPGAKTINFDSVEVSLNVKTVSVDSIIITITFKNNAKQNLSLFNLLTIPNKYSFNNFELFEMKNFQELRFIGNHRNLKRYNYSDVIKLPSSKFENKNFTLLNSNDSLTYSFNVVKLYNLKTVSANNKTSYCLKYKGHIPFAKNGIIEYDNQYGFKRPKYFYISSEEIINEFKTPSKTCICKFEY